MENDIYYITGDVSSRHSAFVLWNKDKPIDLETFIDKNKIDYYDGCDILINKIKKMIEKNCLQIKDIDYIYIEQPIHYGPNQNTVVLLAKFVYTFAYSVYKLFGKKPILVNQAKVKKSVIGKQKNGVDKKALVEKKMLIEFKNFYNKLPHKRLKSDTEDIFKTKYKTNISDLSDSLALGKYVMKNNGKF